MLQSLVSPLAPAAILLLSAFILPTLPPERTPGSTWRRYVNAPVLASLALLALLVIRITPGVGVGESGLEAVSSWDFLTGDSVGSLAIRADIVSLPFLIVTLFTLLIVTMLSAANTQREPLSPDSRRVSGWLLMGAAACFLFVTANRLTIVYGVMLFDIVTAGYWLLRGHKNVATARLGLGVITAGGLILVSAPGAINQLLLGLALWLRLGLYPLSEASVQSGWRDDDRLIYFSLSVIVGIYLAARAVSTSLPTPVQWLVLLTMLACGLLAWLTGLFTGEAGQPEATAEDGGYSGRLSPLLWLILAELLIVLLAAPLPVEAAAAFVMGAPLSLLALWLTPQLGKPRLSRRAWRYLPAVMATLTLGSAPLTLGWLAKVDVYRSLVSVENLTLGALILVAEGLALSALVGYWLALVQGNEQHTPRSMASLVIAMPFLTPVLGPFVVAAIIQTELILPDPVVYFWSLGATAVIVTLAVLAGHYRQQIVRRFEILWLLYSYLSDWSWLASLDRLLSRASRIILRVQIILEGQHYMGWAVFAALVGSLIILLS